MAFLLGVFSVFCLVYYGVIAAYAGVETSFSAIWLVLSFFLALGSVLLHFYGRFKDRVPIRLEVTVVTIVAAFLLYL